MPKETEKGKKIAGTNIIRGEAESREPNAQGRESRNYH